LFCAAQALIEHLQLVIAKMKARDVRSLRAQPAAHRSTGIAARGTGRGAAEEDEAKAKPARIPVQGFTRRQATRRIFAADLPRRRIVHPAPISCSCCGSSKLSKIGEDVTETLDVIPRQWFVTEHVREKFSCRACEKTRVQKPITISPIAFEAVQKFDAIFMLERSINGL
jgi:transposase